MEYSRIVHAQALADSEKAVESGGNLVCEVFAAEMLMSTAAASANPATVTIQSCGQTIQVINDTDNDISAGDIFKVGQAINERWYIIRDTGDAGGGGGGQTAVFKTKEEIPGRSQTSETEGCETPGHGEGEMWKLSKETKDGAEEWEIKMCPVQDADGYYIPYDLYNVFAVDIPSERFVIASKINGYWVIHAEDCPSGSTEDNPYY